MATLERILFVAAALLYGCMGTAAMTNQDAYPGLRRPPASKIVSAGAAGAAASSNSYDENYLSQILSFIEEQARRKFLEKVKSYHSKPIDEGADVYPDSDAMDGDFTFKMPPMRGKVPAIDEPIDFGVAPNDPRFYENTMREENEDRQRDPVEQGEEDNMMDNSMDGLEKASNEGGPYLRIKGPLIVNPKPNPGSYYKSKEMQGLLHKLGRNNNNNVGAGFDSRLGPGMMPGQDVVQRPVNLEAQTSISVYAVALIAGVSAAITIGLIALGVGWYTFYKKSKAAQDVEYPAYGVTGPNKDKLSPTSGDRRLAQNAQMYHYQHQKQQIIAMENKMNEDRHGSLSDAANSEDEEGDYTVYECPGLAHTGEMEVKNPLFFDDPTPATPGNSNQAPAAKAQPKAASAPPAPSADKKANDKKGGKK